MIQKEPAARLGSRTFSPFFDADIRTPVFSADFLKKCALMALHAIAEEGRDGDGCHVPGLGDEWKMGCPKCPMRESEGEVWSEDESVSSTGSCECNVCNDALHVIGLQRAWWQDLTFPVRLGVGTGGIELSHGPGHAVPRNVWGQVAGLPLPRSPLTQPEKPFSHRGRGCGERK